MALDFSGLNYAPQMPTQQHYGVGYQGAVQSFNPQPQSGYFGGFFANPYQSLGGFSPYSLFAALGLGGGGFGGGGYSQAMNQGWGNLLGNAQQQQFPSGQQLGYNHYGMGLNYGSMLGQSQNTAGPQYLSRAQRDQLVQGLSQQNPT